MNTKPGTKIAADEGLSRRNFLRTSATAGLGLAFAGRVLGQEAGPQTAKPSTAKNPDELRVAVIGCGAQGRVLIESILRIPSIRIAAICDIWSYSQTYTANYLKKYGHIVRVYEDYRDLLAKEKDLQAAIVATPDWMHAEHANACLRAGLPVYCEKEMSNSLEKAQSMVQAARETKNSSRSATSAAPTRATSTPSTGSSTRKTSSGG
ncbi:MAG: Gfo/Idh/MocA family protein [Candidatus Aminicenantales bacterium]